MSKPKKRLPVALQANEDNNRSGYEMDPTGEESWVVVKKQRITILIPPLPVTKISSMPSPEPSNLQAVPEKTNNAQRQCSPETYSHNPSVDDREKSVSLAPKKGIPSQHFSKFAKPPILNHRTVSENRGQVRSFRFRNNILGLCSESKVGKRSISFLDRDLLVNQKMRASNLERKLRRAGGLRSWLASLGLDQFVKIFQGKSVSKFQLVNMTMKKLKDMGADAVGPRRKLMHAIDCLCQPYCFEAVRMSKNLKHF